MLKNRVKSTLVLLPLVGLLAACGGGGHSTASPTDVGSCLRSNGVHYQPATADGIPTGSAGTDIILSNGTFVAFAGSTDEAAQLVQVLHGYGGTAANVASQGTVVYWSGGAYVDNSLLVPCLP